MSYISYLDYGNPVCVDPDEASYGVSRRFQDMAGIASESAIERLDASARAAVRERQIAMMI